VTPVSRVDSIEELQTRRFGEYPAYKDSGVAWLGEIPAHWEVRRLKTLADVQLSNVDKKSVEGQESVRLCNYTDVYYHEHITGNMQFMAATATPAQVQRFWLRAGDVLITKDSESWTDIAVSAVVAEDLPRVLCGYHLAQIRPGVDCQGAFLSRAFGAIGPRDQFQIAANGITRFGLGRDAISTGVFALPPLAEQRAIAALLDRETGRIDALIAKKERLIVLLEEERTALITRAVTKGLNPDAAVRDSGVEWLGMIPVHWAVKKWRYCCHVAEGQVAPDDDRYRGRILIAPNHIESGTGRILYTETADEQGAISGKYLVRSGDIIYSKIRPALNKVCIARGEWLCSADMYPVSITAKDLLTSYLLYFMLSDPFVRLMVDESMRVAMPKVNREKLAGCPVLLPSRAEQLKIVDFLDRETVRIDALVAKVREAIERLKELRVALISAGVTGKIDAREAS
jgi:type I restriction enzyme S subunit